MLVSSLAQYVRKRAIVCGRQDRTLPTSVYEDTNYFNNSFGSHKLRAGT